MDSGGSTIIGYWLEKRQKGTTYWAKANKTLVSKRGMKTWEFPVTRLIEGTEYEFRVMACNAAGVGPPSAVSESAFADDPISKLNYNICVTHISIYSMYVFMYCSIPFHACNTFIICVCIF